VPIIVHVKGKMCVRSKLLIMPSFCFTDVFMLAIPTHQLLGNVAKIQQQICHDISRYASPVMCQFILMVQVLIIHHLDTLSTCSLVWMSSSAI
jgi:hypothetical protein